MLDLDFFYILLTLEVEIDFLNICKETLVYLILLVLTYTSLIGLQDLIRVQN